MKYSESKPIAEILDAATIVLIMQADNPDADSLGSALALEQILGDLGKSTELYCGVHIPDYLHHLPGWDRVANEIPTKFDASIIVDTSAESLFGILGGSPDRHTVASKPCIVIDHHAVEPTIPYATIILNPEAVATGEVIYELSQDNNWPINAIAKNMLTSAIMSDSLGLTSEGTSARSMHIVADMVEQGVSIAQLESARRELMRKSPDILAYKGKLLERVTYSESGRIALLTIPWEEIEQFSHAYNPSMLVIDDMRMVTGVDMAIAFKLYKDGKITAKLRCNYGKAVAGELAEQFGGGGHPYASGFKITDGRTLEEIILKCVDAGEQLLDNKESQQ
jgi:phosphoesterase RecJ-like protein